MSDLIKALDDFDEFHKKKAHVTAAAPKVEDVCKTYKMVKPILQGVMPFLSIIPIVGARIAVAINALLAALDVVCPA